MRIQVPGHHSVLGWHIPLVGDGQTVFCPGVVSCAIGGAWELGEGGIHVGLSHMAR
jgi:hypothetical protein